MSENKAVENKMSSAQLRKIKKPVIEKRRRERINESLNQLKALVLDAMDKDENQYSKMEKADILEMTVKHLANLKQKSSPLASPQPEVPAKKMYHTGFHECSVEVKRFLNNAPVTNDVKERLYGYLNGCLKGEGVLDPSVISQCAIAPPPQCPTSTPQCSTTQLVPIVFTGSCMGVDSRSSGPVIPLYVQGPSISSSAGLLKAYPFQHVDSLYQTPTIPLNTPANSRDHAKDSTVSAFASVYYPNVSMQPIFQHHQVQHHLGLSRYDVQSFKSLPRSLPASPVSSRSMDTPSPGSVSSDKSCDSMEVWRPW